ncbi:putative serine esterase-domain-containing protein [Aspergillus egyptiacus]|nr:putative serine esterase-domain-containing protein [Aspergillus egyptiacus]
MLVTPRTFSASQVQDQNHNPRGSSIRPRFYSLRGWHSDSTDPVRGTEMLLIRQAGSLRVGEVIRYTLTYDPAADGIHPPRDALHVRIKNTSATPLRAAYLHGPYTLYASCYPSSFNPYIKFDPCDATNIPQFEPYLKAGGSWNAVIPIRRHVQQSPPHSTGSSNEQNVTWIIEIISQVVFSNRASVSFEVLVGRDEASVDLLPSHGQTKPPKAANLRDHWPSGSGGKHLLASHGVFSESITLLIDDTASLWNTPHLPISRSYRKAGVTGSLGSGTSAEATVVATDHQDLMASATGNRGRKKIHLVVLTHGLHSNLGADMLYLKESIDAASKSTAPKQETRDSFARSRPGSLSSDGRDAQDTGDCQEEQVIVRGFPGNAARTERGIQYLGKRLAKYVLLMTYPDQPHLPCKKTKAKTSPGPFSSWRAQEDNHKQAEPLFDTEPLNQYEHHPYRITSISFIGHSLGGLVQTYAIAYIQKHSPDFFNKIRPVNFIALATPFLGLSNENPLYVRFALDFGLVGRTGQDLGLSWTVPNIRSGWETIIGGKGDSSKHARDADARSKPLLRILPSGPAHEVLAKFKRRTIYSNLVNDGIVPLRTSCLLFLDWKGLGRVEKARRENGIVGTMAEWGWAELTGANSKSPKVSGPASVLDTTGASRTATETIEETMISTVPPRVLSTQPNSPSTASSSSVGKERAEQKQPVHREPGDASKNGGAGPDPRSPQTLSSPLSGLFSVFKPNTPACKQTKILRRSQTIATPVTAPLLKQEDPNSERSSYDVEFDAPPKTTVFESAGDILMPPLPPLNYIIDPASRPRTIWHDRIYQPEDIPPAPPKRQTPLINTELDDLSVPTRQEPTTVDGLKVEERIARAYHRRMSWRKVLVRLEPDAHNNIIVRRMFANAYGWPVVQHLVDNHFGQAASSSLEESCEDVPRSTTSPVGQATKDATNDHTQLSSILLNANIS